MPKVESASLLASRTSRNAARARGPYTNGGNAKAAGKKLLQDLAWAAAQNKEQLVSALTKFGNNGITFAPKGKTQTTPVILDKEISLVALEKLYQNYVAGGKKANAPSLPAWKTILKREQAQFKNNLASGAVKISGNKWNTGKVLTALGQDPSWRRYFNTTNQLRTALNKTLSRNVSLIPQGVFRPPTQNPNINLQTARAIVAAARVNREASHYTGSYLQAHLGDFLETVSFTIGAQASGAFPVYWKDPTGPPRYGLSSDRNWAGLAQYFDANWPYDITVILESEVPFENTIKQFAINTPNINKKLFVNILKTESDPRSHTNAQGRPTPATTWTALPATPYKGWGFGKPDGVIVRRYRRVNGSVYYVIMILELKIGIGKPEAVPAEMFQLLKIMKSLEILTEVYRRQGIDVRVEGYFVPWFYGVLQKTRPSFTTIDSSIAGDFLTTYTNFIRQYPSYKIKVVSTASEFREKFGLNTDAITATLNQHSAAWFQKQGEIVNKLVRSGRAFGALAQNELESARNAAKAVLARMNVTNRNYDSISNFLKRTQAVVVPSARPGRSSRLAALQHPNWAPYGPYGGGGRAAKFMARAATKTARKLAARGITTSVPVLSKINAGNSNTNESENETNIIAQAVKDPRFAVNITAPNVNGHINRTNNIRGLEALTKLIGAAPRINSNSRQQLQQKIYMKQLRIAANQARLNPGNARFASQVNFYARKAGVAVPEPNTQARNLEAELRALQQAGRA